jgi:hypothetical protein
MSSLEYMRKWREKNREKLREYNLNYQREWRDNNREKVRTKGLEAYYKHHEKNKAAARYRARFTRYGITKADYDRTFEAQGGVCGICKLPSPFKNRPLCVDHCHNSGKVRGLLCDRCNTRLQALEDLAYRQAAEEYLRTHDSPVTRDKKIIGPTEFK